MTDRFWGQVRGVMPFACRVDSVVWTCRGGCGIRLGQDRCRISTERSAIRPCANGLLCWCAALLGQQI